MLAALEGNTSIGRLLISSGAEVGRTNNSGETALSLAAHGGHSFFVKLLLDHGASADCHPHGHTLEDWLRTASGLQREKLAAILKLIQK
jgi:ankyrin repeat protein